MTKLLFALLLALPAAALAESSAGPAERHYDDSDPEMRQLLDAFFALVPCPQPEGAPLSNSGLCPQALAMLSGGSDRLATYLIRQYESPAEPAPPMSRWTYLRLLGHTESRVAFDYLSALVAVELAAKSADDTRLQFAIEGLGRTRDKRVVPIALDLLEQLEGHTELQLRALGALDRVQAKHGPQPEIAEALRLREAEGVARMGEADPSARGVSEWTRRVLENPGATYP